jgi:hypothetical protein
LGCGCGVELVVCVSVVRVWLCFWVFGCFLVQFLGGLLAVREPAGCVHACSKWQTSAPSPASRERGIMECGSEASAHAEANASALQTGQRAAPLSHAVGEGLGVRAESGRTLHTVNPSDVPLSGGWEGVCRKTDAETLIPLPRPVASTVRRPALHLCRRAPTGSPESPRQAAASARGLSGAQTHGRTPARG